MIQQYALKQSKNVFTVKELDRELISRGARSLNGEGFCFPDKEGTHRREEIFKRVRQIYHPNVVPPSNPALKHFSTQQLMQKMRLLTEGNRPDSVRGVWRQDDRVDYYDITDEKILRNVRSTVIVCYDSDLRSTGRSQRELRIKHYGDTYNLSACEPFHNQPVTAGFTCTGVLVAPDVIATAAHFADEKNVKKLLFIFGYIMTDAVSPVTVFAEKDIYRGVGILGWKRDARGPESTGSDWTLVKLDRKVTGQKSATLSKRNLFYEQPVYTIGYPCGLPLKVAPGIVVQNDRKAYFMAEMDVFNNNSGSPVFDAETHEMVGIVSRADCRDFQWSADGVVSIVYPNSEVNSQGIQCTRVSEFIKFCSS